MQVPLCIYWQKEKNVQIKIEKVLTSLPRTFIIIKHSAIALCVMRNCVMVAPTTLTRIVRVRILLPQPESVISVLPIFYGV